MCDVSRCKRVSILSYADFGPKRNKDVGICQHHWEKHCNDGDKFAIKDHFYPLQVEKKKR